MKSVVKQKWIEALRSGEYEQIYEQLWDYEDFSGKNRACLLGVLCDLAVKEGVADHYEPDFDLGEFGYVPEAVEEWAELDDDTVGAIVDLNDYHHVSFSEFSDFLERIPDDEDLRLQVLALRDQLAKEFNED